jgi:hypothetical protein
MDMIAARTSILGLTLRPGRIRSKETRKGIAKQLGLCVKMGGK